GSELALETATFFASPLSFPPELLGALALAVDGPLPASPDSVLPVWALPEPDTSPLSAEVSLPPVLPPSADWIGTLAWWFDASPDSALPVSLLPVLALPPSLPPLSTALPASPPWGAAVALPESPPSDDVAPLPTLFAEVDAVEPPPLPLLLQAPP